MQKNKRRISVKSLGLLTKIRALLIFFKAVALQNIDWSKFMMDDTEKQSTIRVPTPPPVKIIQAHLCAAKLSILKQRLLMARKKLHCTITLHWM